MVNCVRTWKRDGSTNVMGIRAAACNLLRNGRWFKAKPGFIDHQEEVGKELRGMTARDIEMLLSQGGRHETPLAWFTLSTEDER